MAQSPAEPREHPRQPSDNGPFLIRPKYVVLEKHLVVEGKQDEVIDFYIERVLPVLNDMEGYLGMAVLSCEPDGVEMDAQGILGIGLPDDLLQPHAGLRPNAGPRTEFSIHVDALTKGTFNLIYEHYLETDDAFHRLHDDIERLYKERWNVDLWDDLAEHYFAHFLNHWDTVYRFTRFG
jgi:hypothetical protein